MPWSWYGLKPGDILVARSGTGKKCLTPGRDYKVYDASNERLVTHCDGFYNDTDHYITEDWEKYFTRKETSNATGK